MTTSRRLRSTEPIVPRTSRAPRPARVALGSGVVRRALAIGMVLAACGGRAEAPQPATAPVVVPSASIADAAPVPSDVPPAPLADAAPLAADAATVVERKPDDLVDLAELDPTIRLDLRYATANNFTGKAVYPRARCLLRRAIAERLVRVQAALAAVGKGLLVWDCYRPLSVQEAFWALVPDERYVARPVRGPDGTPKSGSKHNRGAAVDLAIVAADGSALELPTEFDDFSPRAHRTGKGWSKAARASAKALEAAMVAEGFEPLPTEWWHFDGPGWRDYPLGDQSLDAAAPAR